MGNLRASSMRALQQAECKLCVECEEYKRTFINKRLESNGYDAEDVCMFTEFR